MNKIGEETKYLAMHALKEAFYTDFSALVNQYLAFAEGLDVDLLKAQLCETANVYSRDEEAENDFFINLHTTCHGGFGGTNFDTILDALNYRDAKFLYLQGETVATRKDGEWYFE